MNLILRVVGDWGEARRDDVCAVAYSAAGHFAAAIDNGGPIAVTIMRNTSEQRYPVTLNRSIQPGHWIVLLHVSGRLWAKLAYQFAHEFCHVLADPGTWTVNEFAWLEEAICETASLFALRRMAKSWVTTPPYLNWSDYAPHLWEYAENRITEHHLADETFFADWFRRQLPLLEGDPYRREDNTIVAQELLPVFEADPTAWRVVRFLPHPARSEFAGLTDFVRAWHTACPEDIRPVVERIAAVLEPT
jgi:hypothetical protein